MSPALLAGHWNSPMTPLVCSFSACFAFSIQGKTHAVCLSLLPGVFAGRMQKMLDVSSPGGTCTQLNSKAPS